MKNIMKLLSVFLCLVVAFGCFTACDKNTDKNNGVQGDKTNTDDVESMTFGDEREVIMDGKEITLPVISIKIDGKIINLPCTVNEFAEQSDCDFPVTRNLTEILEPDHFTEVDAFFESGIAQLYIHNNTSKDITFGECMIYSLEYIGEFWENIEFPIGFSLSSDITEKEIKDALGKPAGVETNSFDGRSLYYLKTTELGACMYGFAFQENQLVVCEVGFGLNEDL